MITILGSYTIGDGGWLPFECISLTSGSAVGRNPSSVTNSDNSEVSRDIVPLEAVAAVLLFIGPQYKSTKLED